MGLGCFAFSKTLKRCLFYNRCHLLRRHSVPAPGVCAHVRVGGWRAQARSMKLVLLLFPSPLQPHLSGSGVLRALPQHTRQSTSAVLHPALPPQPKLLVVSPLSSSSRLLPSVSSTEACGLPNMDSRCSQTKPKPHKVLGGPASCYFSTKTWGLTPFPLNLGSP